MLHTKIRVDPVFTLELKIPSTDDSHTQKRAACQEIFIEKDTIKHFFLQPFFIHVGITTEKNLEEKARNSTIILLVEQPDIKMVGG